MDETMKISTNEINNLEAHAIITEVHRALAEKGYDPVTQIVGYIMSGDPSYITSHRNARGIIRRMERDELLEALVRAYVEKQ